MFTDLAIDIAYMSDSSGTITRHSLYLPGHNLLSWVNDVSGASFVKGATVGLGATGAEDDPIVLAGVEKWLGATNFAKRNTNRDIHLSIAGRRITVQADGRNGGHADGFYVRDNVLSGTSDVSGTVWNRHGGASYREFGKFLHAKQSAMEGVIWSQRIAARLRMILKGKVGGHAKGGGAALDLSAAGAGHAESALPLLSAAMFISEPGRNPRAWLVGLMMLDLMGDEYVADRLVKDAGKFTKIAGKYYTVQRAFVNPKRLDDPAWAGETNEDTDQAPGRWVHNMAHRGVAPVPVSKKDRERLKAANKTETTMGKVGSAAVEGLYPPSPKWSASSSHRVDVANDYIQQKELSVACRWMEREFENLGGSTVRCRALKEGERGRRENAMTKVFADSAMRGFAAELEQLTKSELLGKRSNSFNTTGMLFR